MAPGPGFFTRLKENWRRLKQGRPGSRFLDCFHYKQQLRHKYGPIYRRIDIGLGLTTAVFGLVMVPAPGPGWIIVFCGMALLAGESEKTARAMDTGEKYLRGVRARIKRSWRQASLAVKSAMTFTAGALASALGYGAYCLFQAIF